MERLKTNELSLGLNQTFRSDLVDNFEKIQKGVDGQSDSLNKQILDMLGNVAPQGKNEVTQARIDGNGKLYDTLKGRADATQATAETALSEERDTSAEVQDARTNSSSQTYPTLKARMDSQENDLNNSINNKLSKISSVPETFTNLAAIQSKYPNGSNGIMVAADNGHKYIWANSTWADAGVYQSVGLSNGSITSPKLADDVNHRLYSYADSIKKLNRSVDPAFVLGVIDPSTHVPNVSDHSIKIHSRMIPVSNDVLYIQLPSTANCIVYYYKSGQYVGSDPLFKDSGHTNPDIDADGVIVLCGYSGDIDMTNASDLGDQITITSLASANIMTRVDKAYQLDGLHEIPFLYRKNINTGFGVGNTVPLTVNNISGFKLAQIDCNGGDFYLINGSGGNSPRLWTFLDENLTILSTAEPNVSASDLLIIAPKKAKLLVINQKTDLPCFKVDREATRNFKVDYRSFPQNNSIQLGRYALGDVVDLTPAPTINYRYLITDCQAGDQIDVVGQGGNNPRIYGFLDANNKLLEIADVNTQGQINHMVITAPANTATVVFNFQFPTIDSLPTNASLRFDRESISAGLLSQRDKEITNVIGKLPIAQVPQNSEDYMASFVSGNVLATQLNNHIGDLAMPTDLMAHCSSFLILNDIVYSAFYVNRKTPTENSLEHTAVLRIANLSDMSTVTNIDLCNINDIVLGKTVSAIYDTVVEQKEDDPNTLYLLFTARLNDEYYLLYRQYNIATKQLSDIGACNFTVGNATNYFSNSGMKLSLDANKVPYPAFNSDISFMQKLSVRVENGIKYYYAGIGVLNFCFIAKSSDLINWQYVAQPDFPNTAQYEPAIYVVGDLVYYLCRQDLSSPYAFLTTYNLVTHVWQTPVNIPDTQSRSVMFTNSNALYALHAPKDRNHIAILHIDYNTLELSSDVAVADVNDTFYPFIYDYNGQLYVTATQSRKHIWLSKVDVPDTSASIAKLKQVLGS